MAELVDALVSGTSGSNTLEVRVFLSAPFYWGCSSVDRALRSHRRGRGFESHRLHQNLGPWGYGGMVDAEDLKSFGHCDRVGSSPTIPTRNKPRITAVFFICFWEIFFGIFFLFVNKNHQEQQTSRIQDVLSLLG